MSKSLPWTISPNFPNCTGTCATHEYIRCICVLISYVTLSFPKRCTLPSMDRIPYRMSRPYVTLSALVCLLGFIAFFLTRDSTPSPLPLPSGHKEPFSLAAFYTKIPYTSSWGSWWHPQRSQGRGSSEIGRGWNILYHLGGNGPWIEKVEGVVKGGIGVPEGCRVEQVHMVCTRISTTALFPDSLWRKHTLESNNWRQRRTRRIMPQRFMQC